jgi:hypothetical protein
MFVISASAVSQSTFAEYGRDEFMVKAQVELTKAQFAAGDPIAVRITIGNDGTIPIKTSINYPTLRTADSAGIIFDLAGTALRARAPSERQVFADDFGGEVPIVPIGPNQRFVIHVYLQRFIMNPEPGEYRIPYSLAISYFDKTTGGTRNEVSTRGTLTVSVSAAKSSSLSDAIKGFEGELDSKDFWRRSEAVEALSLIEDPRVVPALLTMVQLGLLESGLEALAKFPTDMRARSAVTGALDSNQSAVVVKALGVLGAWNHHLGRAEIERLERRNDSEIEKAIREYRSRIK